MASNDTSAEQEERLKSALWYSIGKYIDEECLTSDVNATPQFIGALTELVYTQIANTSRDLETFSAHAGRSVINTDDVMLLARRNDALEEMLKREFDAIKAGDGRENEGGGGRRKSAGGGGSGGNGAGKKRGRPAGGGKGRD